MAKKDKHIAASNTCLVFQEEKDPVVGHQPHLLIKALDCANLALKRDVGIASAIKVGAICQPRITRSFRPKREEKEDVGASVQTRAYQPAF